MTTEVRINKDFTRIEAISGSITLHNSQIDKVRIDSYADHRGVVTVTFEVDEVWRSYLDNEGPGYPVDVHTHGKARIER